MGSEMCIRDRRGDAFDLLVTGIEGANNELVRLAPAKKHREGATAFIVQLRTAVCTYT